MHEQFPPHTQEVYSPRESSSSPHYPGPESTEDIFSLKMEILEDTQTEFLDAQGRMQSARRQEELNVAARQMTIISEKFVGIIADPVVQANVEKIDVDGDTLGLIDVYFRNHKVPTFNALLSTGNVLRKAKLNLPRENQTIYERLIDFTDPVNWQLSNEEKSWLEKIAVASALQPTDPDKEAKEARATQVYLQPLPERKTMLGGRVVDATHTRGVIKPTQHNANGQEIRARRKPSKLHQLFSPKQRRLLKSGYYEPKIVQPKVKKSESPPSSSEQIPANSLTFDETRKLLREVPITLTNRLRLSGISKGMTPKQALEVARDDALKRLQLDREIRIHQSHTETN